jgi:sirohydrochlorin ferrochelatase
VNRLLIAHGTRKSRGVAMIADLAERVGALLDSRVRVAFVDVLGPTPAEVLAATDMVDAPAVVVPAFLARGYHVRIDVPDQIATSGHRAVTVTPALGPSREMVRVLAENLIESGWRQGDSVILGAAGTSDSAAQTDLRATATLLSATIGSRVEPAFADPRISDAVRRLRARGGRRVAIASYLLADGLFQDRLRAAGADLVTDPLGALPGTARLIASRFRRAHLCAEL